MKLLLAATLTFVNHTGTTARITDLRNKCEDTVISEVQLKPNESFKVKVQPVIQTYMICAAGYCSASAIGTKPKQSYQLEIILDKDGFVSLLATPDHWSSSNKECPK